MHLIEVRDVYKYIIRVKIRLMRLTVYLSLLTRVNLLPLSVSQAQVNQLL